MTKSNPLFVDSTKLHGDRIGAQIELTGVLVYDTDRVSVNISDHLGQQHRLEMKVHDDGAPIARVWLQHQKPIAISFSIDREGQSTLHTGVHQLKAQYVISLPWQPILGEFEAEKVAEAPAVKPSFGLPDTPWAGDYAQTVEALIEKWNL